MMVYPGRTKPFSGKRAWQTPLRTDIEEILDAVAPGPVPQDLALGAVLESLAGDDVIDDGLDAAGSNTRSLPRCLQVHDGWRRGDFMAEDGVQPDDV
jgi:hypothetical protein